MLYYSTSGNIFRLVPTGPPQEAKTHYICSISCWIVYVLILFSHRGWEDGSGVAQESPRSKSNNETDPHEFSNQRPLLMRITRKAPYTSYYQNPTVPHWDQSLMSITCTCLFLSRDLEESQHHEERSCCNSLQNHHKSATVGPEWRPRNISIFKF